MKNKLKIIELKLHESFEDKLDKLLLDKLNKLD